jgi:two-component system NtrC family response regulator
MPEAEFDGTILFIDDDATGREVATYNLAKAGFAVEAAGDGEEGLARFDPERHAVVVTDLKMPRIDGMEVLARVHEVCADTPVLVITAFGSMEVGVEAMRAGAYDVLAKPFQRDQLELTVRRAAERARLLRDNRRLRRELAGVERPIVHGGGGMADMLATADRVAASDATVLIRGESGTGKELVARRIHARSSRADGPFVSVSCAALPAELLESELFGHTRGAFTGAVRARQGRFRAADTGTLFLDEIGELPRPLQGKLLRVLQERAVDVLGRDTPIPVDIRLVAATNRELRADVDTGEFREDLFYRLAVVEVPIPPLRTRPEDIEPLARHFVALHGGEQALEIDDEAIAALGRRRWPGNVRELENACERMAILATRGRVRADDLPPEVNAGGGGATGDDAWLDQLPEGLSLVDLEKRAIEHALRRTGGNLSAAARRLGVPRHILIYRVEKHGIPRGR